MKYIRWQIISLILSLAVFFNIERLDFDTQDMINIDSYVYLLGCLAIISVMALPFLWRTHVSFSIIGCIGIYLISKYLFGNHPLSGSIYTYISIVEAMFLVILTWLSHGLARVVHEFEKAVGDITLANVNQRVQPLDEVHEIIKTHMLHSRRQQHPLGVVIVEPDPETISANINRVIQDIQKSMAIRYTLANLSHTISTALRRTDLMMVQEQQNRFVILCPETDAEKLDVFMRRVQEVVDEQYGLDVLYGNATFPDDAVTFEELMSTAVSNLSHINGSSAGTKNISTGIKKRANLDKVEENGKN